MCPKSQNLQYLQYELTGALKAESLKEFSQNRPFTKLR